MEITEKNKYSTGDICKWVRETLRKKYPEIKFSVRVEYYSMGSSIHVTLLESKRVRFIKKLEEVDEHEMLRLMNHSGYTRQEAEAMVKRFNEEKRLQVNHHCGDDWRMTVEGNKLLTEITKIVQKYNYDNSDVQTDYFDVNYYVHMNVGSYDRPFVDGSM